MRYFVFELITILLGLILLAILINIFYLQKHKILYKIKKTKEISVITRNNANCYYIYRNEPKGFEYDLAKAFSDYLDVDLKVKTEDWNNMFQAINKGKGDFIASQLTITNPRKEKVAFSDPYMQVQQQVIVHRRNRKITQLEDLTDRSVHVRKGTSYELRLKELSKERNLDINIITYKDIPTEELIRKVAQQKIKITIADSNIALLNRRYYPNIRIAFPITEEQNLGWAVKKSNKALLNKINDFFEHIKENGDFAKIYERYYAHVHIFDYVDIQKFHQRICTRLPKYNTLIMKTAQKYGFDWRLIAAIIYQESHFNPKATSYTGVKGLMQVTLTTAKEMGISNRLDPKQSVKAGVKYLKKLYNRWDEIKGRNRLLFALASYNIGYGHVRDAQQIAKQKGLNPHKWSSLEKTLPLLRIKSYYKNTRYGYARGTEPIRYVRRVLTYYDILKKKAVYAFNHHTKYFFYCFVKFDFHQLPLVGARFLDAYLLGHSIGHSISTNKFPAMQSLG